jgi:hypothetical protein
MAKPFSVHEISRQIFAAVQPIEKADAAPHPEEIPRIVITIRRHLIRMRTRPPAEGVRLHDDART